MRPRIVISSSWLHPYLALLLHRDYFRRPVSSLSCSFAPQGLFLPFGFILILFFCSAGIISSARIHPYLALLLHRDYFYRLDSSLSCSFAPQGLFLPSEFILILLFCSTGIISTGQFHPCLALLLHRDDFGRPVSSLPHFSTPQGLFLPFGFILILFFCSAGIISTGQFHPYLVLLCHRDYFGRPNSSLSCSFVPQGLFRPSEFILILLFCSAGIISAVRIHPYLALLFRGDYFGRPNSSLSCSFVPQRLFLPYEFILILLFCSAEIISSARIHPCLALLLDRDYF